MSSIYRFKLGDFIKVPDGRIGTMVYNGLEGIGIKWGKHKLTDEDREQILGLCPLFDQKPPSGYNWKPDAMLRDQELTFLLGMECVGDEMFCEIIEDEDLKK